MKENIYSLLNQIDNQAEQYSPEEATPVEVKKWKARFSSSQKAPAKSHKKAIAAAAACLCLFAVGTAVTPVRHVAYAAMKTVSYNVAHLLGIEKDLSPYSAVTGKSITKGGYTVTLNEAILDEGTLHVSHTLTLPTKLESSIMNYYADAYVFINGKFAYHGASGSSEQADDYNIVTYSEIDLAEGIDTSRPMDIELFFIVEDEEAGKTLDMGTIAFSASGAELAASTYTTNLDYTLTLPDGAEVIFYKYSSNSLGQRIYFTCPEGGIDYDILLTGEDNLGNPVEFTLRTINSSGKGRMEVSTIHNGYISDDAETLTLTPKIAAMPQANGKMSNDFQTAGESFTIPLS